MKMHLDGPSCESSDRQTDPTMKIITPEKPTQCPWCGSTKIALLLSGMPVFIPDLDSDLDSGGIAIGNPKKRDNAPAWQCTGCFAQFYREPRRSN